MTFTQEEIAEHIQLMFEKLKSDFRIPSFLWLWTPTGYRLCTFPKRTYHGRRKIIKRA